MVIRAVIREDTTEIDAEKAARIIKKPREECKMVLDAVIEDRRNHKRQPKPEPPEGGISLRAAGRKYNTPPRTISRWVEQGFLPTILETKNEKFINEATFAELIAKYNSDLIIGRRTIRKAIALAQSQDN